MKENQQTARAQYTDSRMLIGETVDIQIDRPLGSRHPEHDFIYPVNYGFVPGVPGRDGEELDAYVLGVDRPVKCFTGRCIAVIQRSDDADDKLVVIPEGEYFTDEQIRVLTEFQERYFESSISREGLKPNERPGEKPVVLYHGSPERVNQIEPKFARGVGPESDRKTAVYATHSRNFAITFSLPLIPSENGDLSFVVEYPEGSGESTEPRIDLEVGSLDLDRPGYVYVLPSDTFEQVDAWQWASRVPVEPLNVIRIDPERYAHWIRDRRPGKS